MSTILIKDSNNPEIEDLNLQVNDIGKVYEFEGLVRLKKLKQILTNNETSEHQYILELQEVSKFKEED